LTRANSIRQVPTASLDFEFFPYQRCSLAQSTDSANPDTVISKSARFFRCSDRSEPVWIYKLNIRPYLLVKPSILCISQNPYGSLTTVIPLFHAFNSTKYNPDSMQNLPQKPTRVQNASRYSLSTFTLTVHASPQAVSTPKFAYGARSRFSTRSQSYRISLQSRYAH
jgi:hypothetical protein